MEYPAGVGNLNNIIKIYEDLRNCNNGEEVLSRKRKFEAVSSNEANTGEEFTSKSGKRSEVEKLCKLTNPLERLIEEVKELIVQGNFSDGITIEEEAFVELPTTELLGGDFQSSLNELVSWLRKDDVSTIGVWGMGGVGKTTLLTHAHNEILKDGGNVYWVTASKDCTVYKLQDELAKCMKLDLSKENDQLKRAGLLKEALERKERFIIFLDDMWSYFDLFKDVGVPEKFGCKVILTTRSKHICKQMQCNEIVEVIPLSQKESWLLFIKNVGHEIPPAVEQIAQLIVKECAGLPLGLVTLARSMRKCDDIREWRNVLNNLKNSRVGFPAMEFEDEVFHVLRLSYDRLNNPIAQECLLYCATYPEDYEISREELIFLSIGSGLFGKIKNLHEMIDEGHSIVNTLERSCLLLGCDDRCKVKMHDLIRDMALRIAGSRFMVKSSSSDSACEEEWTKHLEVVSLMSITCSRISISPKCPRLKVLSLKNDLFGYLYHDTFFKHMHGLRVINWRGLLYVPRSILSLKNLTVLILRFWGQDIPSLANLTSLIILELSDAQISVLPNGLDMLTNLKYLNFLRCVGLRMNRFPKGALSKLIHLEYLLCPRWLSINVDELKMLTKLKQVEGRVKDLRAFNKYVRHANKYGGLISYKLEVDPSCYERPIIYHTDCKAVRFSCVRISNVELPKDIKQLYICEDRGLRSLSDVSSMQNATHLEICSILCCYGMESLFSSPISPNTFSLLRYFSLSHSPKVKVLFTVRLFANLQNLENLEVEDCNELEAVIARSSSSSSSSSNDHEDANNEQGIDVDTFALPKLKHLTLNSLPKLKSICSSSCGVFALPNLVSMRLHGVPKLDINCNGGVFFGGLALRYIHTDRNCGIQCKPVAVNEASLPSSLLRFNCKKWAHL